MPSSSVSPVTLLCPVPAVFHASTRTDEEVREQILGIGNPLPKSIRLDFFRYSTELKSEFGIADTLFSIMRSWSCLLCGAPTARRIQYFIPYGLRWLTSPIFSMLFDKKLLNLDTEHFKEVGTMFLFPVLSIHTVSFHRL